MRPQLQLKSSSDFKANLSLALLNLISFSFVSFHFVHLAAFVDLFVSSGKASFLASSSGSSSRSRDSRKKKLAALIELEAPNLFRLTLAPILKLLPTNDFSEQVAWTRRELT